MDEELSMARSEGDGRPEQAQLLGARGSGISSRSSTRRNKRKETATIKQKAKGRKAKDTSAESKAGAEAKDLNGSTTRQKGYKRGNKDRKPDRRAEGDDRTPRRNSTDLGIEWIGSFCPDGQPHYLVGLHNIYGGTLFKCTNCKKHLWLPTIMQDAAKLDAIIDRFGAENGYRRFLDMNREAKVLVAKMQDLWYARRSISDSEQFMKLIITVMEDKEYDKKEMNDKENGNKTIIK